tara:strand:- start:263 stop:556 length:294 start_codon:yes stop_codon:yes gene_type:complete
MINFNELPSDIKFLIFSKNRKETSDEIKHNRLKHGNVMLELEEMASLTYAEFYDVDEEEEYNDMTYTFSMAMFQCINEYKIEYYIEKQLDHYLDIGY